MVYIASVVGDETTGSHRSARSINRIRRTRRVNAGQINDGDVPVAVAVVVVATPATVTAYVGYQLQRAAVVVISAGRRCWSPVLMVHGPSTANRYNQAPPSCRYLPPYRPSPATKAGLALNCDIPLRRCNRRLSDRR